MDIELIKKYCDNSCTQTELENVLKWFRDSPESEEGKALMCQIWNELQEADDNPEVNFDILLDSIHHKVNLTHSNKLFQKTYQVPVKAKEINLKRIITLVAATLFLPVLAFGLYMYFNSKSERILLASYDQSYNEVFSSSDAITKVTLMDGSNVWLNHNSSLKYPSVFQGDDRRVELRGEGYFEVASNSKKPFIVKADELEIKAIGTTFNIMSFPEENMIETSLINGVVQLQRIDSDGNIIPLLDMKPTDLATFNKESKKITVRDINDDRYFSWKEGKLIFNREPMGEVARKLSRWFNVDIEIKDAELLELTYTATFVNETLPQVMELLAMMSPVSYSISNRVQISDGVFAKRKVIINYNEK